MKFIKLHQYLGAMRVAIIGIFTLGGVAISAQEIDDNTGAETQEVIRIEEIVVRVERTLFRMRAQIEYAKEELFSTYNDFNEIDDFDVDCGQSNWSNTRIQQQECWPVFFQKLVAENSQEAMDYGYPLVPVGQLATLYNDKFDALRSNLAKVASEKPQVAKAIVTLETLEQAYKTKREACMEQPAFLFVLRRCP
ncbi:MAG: hypothetical protein HQ498_10340 [Pseudohongiella sp.]|nr:hypothetical protein [Pseudohongiella sp.]